MATEATTRPAATGVFSPGRASIPAKTLRTDRWWIEPAITFAVLLSFVIYATWRAFENKYYFAEPLISPFYSPCLSADCGTVAGSAGVPHLSWFKDWIFLTPALFILIFPLGFRMTCYYYRKAYYRSFWLSPPACAVAEPHKTYTGETKFPLLVQNIHRYFFYAGLIFNVILTYDAIDALRNHDGEFGHMGVGTLVLFVNAMLQWLYSLSCHSCRHAVGGRLNHFSKHPIRYKFWTIVSRLNGHHMKFAWVSLFGVALSDFYVRQVAAGHLVDRLFF